MSIKLPISSEPAASREAVRNLDAFLANEGAPPSDEEIESWSVILAKLHPEMEEHFKPTGSIPLPPDLVP